MNITCEICTREEFEHPFGFIFHFDDADGEGSGVDIRITLWLFGEKKLPNIGGVGRNSENYAC